MKQLMDPINPKSLNFLHFPLIVLTVRLNNHLCSIFTVITRPPQPDLFLYLPEVSCDEWLNVPLDCHLTAFLLKLNIVKLPQFSFNQDCSISPWIWFPWIFLWSHLFQGDFSCCSQRSIVVQSMWVLTHVITKASSSSIIVKIIVAIVLVEWLVAESPSFLFIVEWPIIKIIVVLKRLKGIRVILSKRVFILHTDPRSANRR